MARKGQVVQLDGKTAKGCFTVKLYVPVSGWALQVLMTSAKSLSPAPLLQSKSGGAYRDRTDDPLLAKQVLSQLS